MQKTTITIAAAVSLTAAFTSAGPVEQFNQYGYGTISGKLQYLGMYRDYDNGNNAYAQNLALTLNYTSPELAGFSIGASYVGAGVLNSMDYYNPPAGMGPGENLVANGRVNVLNEGYLNFNMASLGMTNSLAYIGRRINNAEIFRADPFRQKARSIEAMEFRMGEIPKTKMAVGHAGRMSNWLQTGDQAKFRNFGKVFGQGYDTDGVTWAEIVNSSLGKLEGAVFDAVAWDIANLVGARAKFNLTDSTAFHGYFRNENDIGRAADRDSIAAGLSIEQDLSIFKLEGGVFSIDGDDLRFQETTTGINHALGSSMMIYAGQFQGDSDTIYAKATTKIEQTGTKLYGLYNFTHHDTDKAGKTLRKGHELNVVITQPVPKFDGLTVALKVGLGHRDGYNGNPNTWGTDTRLFVTYAF